MRRAELSFDRPAALDAVGPPESRGLRRDEVRLLVSRGDADPVHARFVDLADFLEPGDLVVANESATLPASLPARAGLGDFVLNLSTDFGQGLWLAEPRWSAARPGPLPLAAGEDIDLAGISGRMVAPAPGQERLWFVRIDGDVETIFRCCGQPIRYAYAGAAWPLEDYQTVFAARPGSAEMPSAGRPFSSRVLARLAARGVRLARITLHTGVSSLEVEAEEVEAHPMQAEPFEVSALTARAVNETRARGGRVIAVGMTVVRALESAWDEEAGALRAAEGFTRRFVHPAAGVRTVDGLLTGMHDPVTSHLAMLYAIAGRERVMADYQEALREGYLWHEFGDSHLILP